MCLKTDEGKSCADVGVVCVCVCVCVSVTLSPSCGVGGVGLVTHYKCQKDLSPKPAHLLLGAAGALMESLSLHRQPAPTRRLPSLFFFSLSLTPLQTLLVLLETDRHPLLVRSPRVISGVCWHSTVHTLCARTRSWLQGAFSAGLLLVNWYVTLRPIRAVCWYQGMAVKQTV